METVGQNWECLLFFPRAAFLNLKNAPGTEFAA
jgi:hypothetical protein